MRSVSTIRPVRTKREIKNRHKQWCRARSSSHRDAPQVEISSFDEFVPSHPNAAEEENPLAWLDDHLGGSGERVPF